MTIIEDFCTAFKEAISEYETEMAGKIHPERAKSIEKLREVLDESLREEKDSITFRREMVGYIKKMPVGALAFIPLFDSRLRRKLQRVLDRPCFSESELSIVERAEIRKENKECKLAIKSLTSQVSELVRLLAAERAKDNVEAVNALTVELAREKQNTAFLTKENAVLQQSMHKLASECQTLKKTNETLSEGKAKLQKEYEDLKVKYEALLQKTQGSTEEKESNVQNNQNTY
jgi:hypothetical protein